MLEKDSLKDIRYTDRLLIKGDGFAYILPHLSLRNWISNYTFTFPSDGMMSDDYSVIPHGCATLVFSCDGNRLYGNLFGPSIKPARVGRQANSMKMLFITEFQPAGYYAFSGMPQKELTDILLPFDAVNPILCRLISDKLEGASDINQFIAEIDRIFAAHLKITFYQQEFMLANQIILRSGGVSTVKELSQNVFYSERHLNRIFAEHLGTSVKTFARLVRMNKAIHLLRRYDYSLTQVYMEMGFYDMPHFIRDFKAICGITPNEYRNRMSDFYSEIAKF